MKCVLYNLVFVLLLGFLPSAARAETCGTGEYGGFIYPIENHSIIPGCHFDEFCNSALGPHHMAIDIIPSTGEALDTLVYSPCSGTVKFAKTAKLYGGMVIFECLVLDECVSPFMAHLYPQGDFSGKGLKVKEGETVKVGQLIGYIAPGEYNGGFDYNLHTHFGIRKGHADIGGNYLESCKVSLWNYTGYAKNETCYPYVLADMYDPVEFIDKIVPEKEAKLLGPKPFTPPYDANAKPCLNVTGSAKTNWVFSCEAGTEWLDSYAVGSNVADLAEVKNVTADHRFVAQRYWNGQKFGAVEETAWASVGSGWPQSQTWPTVVNAAAGAWKMDIWFEVKATGEKIPLLPSVEFLVGDISDPAPQSKEAFQLTEVNACTSINWGNNANGWTYTCLDPSSSFLEGTLLVYALAKIENAIKNFRFRTEKYMKVDGILVKQGEADKSQYINIGSGWDKAYTWPRVYKPKAGVWVFDFFIDFEDGSESKHLGIHTVTIEKKPEPISKPAPSVSGGGSWSCLAKNMVSGNDANEWVYTCSGSKDTFFEDEDVVVLARAENIPKNFKFKVKKFWKSKTTPPIVDEMASFINVGTGWAYAYTWPTVPMWQDGTWYFEFFIVFEDGTETLFEEHTLTMQNKGNPDPPPQPIPSVPYVFGSTETCLDHQDGVAPNWDFSCIDPKTVFTEGDMLFVVTKLKQVAATHQIKTIFIQNGGVVWTNIAPAENTWGVVASGTVWNTSFAWPRKGNVGPGNWEADILVRIIGEPDFTWVYTHAFTVLPKGSSAPPFVFMGADACTAMAGPNADWQYWCVDPKTEFSAGSTIIVVAGIEQVFVDHYFKTAIYANGSSVGIPQTSDWTYVGEGWDYAFTWPTVSNVWAGTWEFRVYLVYQTKTGDIEVSLLENVVVKVK